MGAGRSLGDGPGTATGLSSTATLDASPNSTETKPYHLPRETVKASWHSVVISRTCMWIVGGERWRWGHACGFATGGFSTVGRWNSRQIPRATIVCYFSLDSIQHDISFSFSIAK